MPCRTATAPVLSRLRIAGVVEVLAGLVLPASGHAIALNCLVGANQPAPASQGPLRFGIYPGGPAGSVDPTAPPKPENSVRRMAALQALGRSNHFVVRLYTSWTGTAADDDVKRVEVC